MKLSRKELGTICTALSMARTKFLEAPDLCSTMLVLINQQSASEMENLRLYIAHKLRDPEVKRLKVYPNEQSE